MNPLFQQFQQTQASNLGGLYQALSTSSNPIQMFMSLAQGNPQLQSIAQAINCGQDPQQLFYQLCRQRGIDPQAFLNQMKGI